MKRQQESPETLGLIDENSRSEDLEIFGSSSKKIQVRRLPGTKRWDEVADIVHEILFTNAVLSRCDDGYFEFKNKIEKQGLVGLFQIHESESVRSTDIHKHSR